jgi:hypothetical protein
MKKLLLAALVASTVATFQARALVVTVDQVAGYNAGDGEFNISPINGLGSGYGAADLYNNNFGAQGFGTFCINRGVSITVPGQFNATVIGSGIDPVSGNQISVGTAWLFQQFATGTLGGYNYTPGVGRINSAYLLQNAIWVLEGQIGNNFNDIFLNMVVTQFGSLAAAEVDNNQQYGVGVLGLTTVTPTGAPGAPAQPMLTLLPDGGSVLMLMGMGLSGLAVFARKFRS